MASEIVAASAQEETIARITGEELAPELVVEILSPEDRWGEVMEKVGEYFAAGVQMVWLADLQTRRIFVYRSLTDVQLFVVGDQLTGGDVLRG